MLYGISQEQATLRGQELFEQLELPGLWKRTPKQMSGGQKRRLDIVMGLVHDPTLVFLDEPTTGLDPQARANLWEHIAGLRSERGATVFLTTHYLDEADALSDRIMVIDQGRIIASDTAENLKAAVSGDQVDLEVAAATGRPTPRPRSQPSRTPSRSTASTCAAGCRAPARAVPGLLRDLDRDRHRARRRSRCTGPTLDDVFLTLTGRSLRDAEPRPTEARRQPRPREERDAGRATSARVTIVFRRQVRMNLRNPAWVFIGVMQPVLYLLLFGPLLKPIVDSFPGGATTPTRSWCPGLLVQLGMFGAFFAGFGLIGEWREGVDRGRAGDPGQPHRAAGRPARPRRAASCSSRR